MKKIDIKNVGGIALSITSILLGVASTIIGNMQQKENIAKEVAKAISDQAKES